MVISAQWELVLGNTYAYTVLSAFGFFYGGFGAIITPLFGVTASYGENTTEYNNALGFFVLSKLFRSVVRNTANTQSVGCLELLFPAWIFTSVCSSKLIDETLTLTTSSNLVYIGIFFTVQMAFTLVAASYFATADGHTTTGIALKKTAGAFAFVSGMLGYYTVCNLMCQEAMFFSFPMGDTSRFFQPRKAEQ